MTFPASRPTAKPRVRDDHPSGNEYRTTIMDRLPHPCGWQASVAGSDMQRGTAQSQNVVSREKAKGRNSRPRRSHISQRTTHNTSWLDRPNRFSDHPWRWQAQAGSQPPHRSPARRPKAETRASETTRISERSRCRVADLRPKH